MAAVPALDGPRVRRKDTQGDGNEEGEVIALLSRQQVRALDTDAVERLGMPSIVLMENAGRGAAQVLLARCGDRAAKTVVVGGTGQNGGDGWVVARHLHNAGLAPRAVLVGRREKVEGDALVNLQVLEQLGTELHVVAPDEVDRLDRLLGDATLTVDALFGTGLDRPIEGGYAEAVRKLAACAAPCVALDLPSGIDADTGQVLGVATRAVLTPTFAAHKRGLHQFPGAERAGEVVRISIGIPPPAPTEAALFEPHDVARTLARRPPEAHKGTAGHVLVVAGSPGRTGAALLAGTGALRAGAGLVTIATRGAARQALDFKVIELMTAELSAQAAEAKRAALRLAERMRSAVVGPGLGTDDEGLALARALAVELPVPSVLDADALTALSQPGALGALQQAAAPRVLTPHPGEAARLLDRQPADVQADRYAASVELARRSGQVVVLKGARSIVAGPDGQVRVCRRGTPALASAGTGDVLSGVAAARLASAEPLTAAAVATCIHALAGELAARSDFGLFAREVAEALPRAVERCREGADVAQCADVAVDGDAPAD